MSNKTCGECCGFSKSENRCLLLGGRGKAYADNEACRRFSEKKPILPPTNGDKIQQGGNRAIAKFAYKTARTKICGTCAFATIENGKYVCNAKNGQSCFDGIEAWLNAPAESEVCVKQNENHNTQTDLSKADNTESEGEDER